MKIVDAHTHLWKKQDGYNDKGRVFALTNGRSNFGGETRQMMPPYMLTGENNAEMLISNMDYACVSGAVITQEVMDGNQNDYLLSVKSKYPDRIRICSLYEEGKDTDTDGFDGIKLCSCKFRDQDLSHHFDIFRTANEKGLFISIDMADGEQQNHCQQGRENADRSFHRLRLLTQMFDLAYSSSVSVNPKESN